MQRQCQARHVGTEGRKSARCHAARGADEGQGARVASEGGCSRRGARLRLWAAWLQPSRAVLRLVAPELCQRRHVLVLARDGDGRVAVRVGQQTEVTAAAGRQEQAQQRSAALACGDVQRRLSVPGAKRAPERTLKTQLAAVWNDWGSPSGHGSKLAPAPTPRTHLFVAATMSAAWPGRAARMMAEATSLRLATQEAMRGVLGGAWREGAKWHQ